jgi:hypothetical protein
MKACGEVEVLPNFLLTTAHLGAEWFISRPLYAGEKMFYTHSSRAWVGPKYGLDILENRINLLHLPETEPRFRSWTARSLVTIPTTLYISSYEINSETEQTWGLRLPFSWRHVTGWLVSDVSIQLGGRIFKGRSVRWRLDAWRRDYHAVSKRRASTTKPHGDTSQKNGDLKCAASKAEKLASMKPFL